MTSSSSGLVPHVELAADPPHLDRLGRLRAEVVIDREHDPVVLARERLPGAARIVDDLAGRVVLPPLAVIGLDHGQLAPAAGERLEPGADPGEMVPSPAG
jgi:hypothetical protein